MLAITAVSTCPGINTVLEFVAGLSENSYFKLLLSLTSQWRTWGKVQNYSLTS